MLEVTTFCANRSNSNTYLVSHSAYPTDKWLIDAGSTKDILSSLPSNCNIRGVFLTHGHIDHIGELNVILNHFPETYIYCHAHTARALLDPKLNLSLYFEDPIVIHHDRVFLCDEGASVQLFENYNLKVFHTPGHNHGSLCFGVDTYLFTGDSYIPGVEVVTKLKGGDKAQNTKSLARIKSELMLEFPNVMPGHTLKEAQSGLKILGA